MKINKWEALSALAIAVVVVSVIMGGCSAATQQAPLAPEQKPPVESTGACESIDTGIVGVYIFRCDMPDGVTCFIAREGVSCVNK